MQLRKIEVGNLEKMSEFLELEKVLSAESQEQISNLVNNPEIVAVLHKLLETQFPGSVIPVEEAKRIRESGSLHVKNLEPIVVYLIRKVWCFLEYDFDGVQNFVILFVQLKEQLGEVLNSAGIWLSRDGASSSESRKLSLEFLGKVCSKFYTGEAIKAEGGDNIRVALKDADGNIVKSGTEASSEVELMVLLGTSSSGKEPRMPHVSPNRLKLNEGVAVLENVQLKRPVAQKTGRSVWAKNCSLKLVVSSVGYIKDATVERAETGSFLFGDRRGILYKKNYPPQLSDEVWRLLMIRRNHELHKLLEKENINSVEQFLIAYTKDPQSFQKMLKISDSKLKTIVDHAMTCPDIPKSLRVYHSASWKSNDAVVFNVVGCVQGLLHEGKIFVPADNLPEDVKVDARKKIVSAFKHWEDVQPYNIEASTSHLPSPDILDVVDSLEFNEAFGGLNRVSSSLGEKSSGSTSDPNAMDDIADLLASIPWEDIGSPFNSYTSMLGRSDDDLQLQYMINSLDHSGRSRGRLITFIVSVEKFLSIGKGAMAQEVEAHASKKQRCG